MSAADLSRAELVHSAKLFHSDEGTAVGGIWSIGTAYLILRWAVSPASIAPESEGLRETVCPAASGFDLFRV